MLDQAESFGGEKNGKSISRWTWDGGVGGKPVAMPFRQQGIPSKREENLTGKRGAQWKLDKKANKAKKE